MHRCLSDFLYCVPLGGVTDITCWLLCQFVEEDDKMQTNMGKQNAFLLFPSEEVIGSSMSKGHQKLDFGEISS